MNEKRILKTSLTQHGARLKLPAPWVRKMGATQEDREFDVEFDGKKITLKKHHGAHNYTPSFGKLKTDDVIAIRKMHADGVSQRQIARDYGVTWDCIHRIIIGRTWRNVQ